MPQYKIIAEVAFRVEVYASGPDQMEAMKSMMVGVSRSLGDALSDAFMVTDVRFTEVTCTPDDATQVVLRDADGEVAWRGIETLAQIDAEQYPPRKEP